MTPADDSHANRERRTFDRDAIHVLTLTASNARAALSALHLGIGETMAELSGLSLTNRGAMAEATLRLTHLSCEDARAFSDRLAALPGVLSACVEHHLFRP